ncbi:MAG TPA: hypothetical protein VKU60_11745, partial [Chloroflexota bacterium]|nr:hypothetical protein [Chloroflexota bacterium]
ARAACQPRECFAGTAAPSRIAAMSVDQDIGIDAYQFITLHSVDQLSKLLPVAFADPRLQAVTLDAAIFQAKGPRRLPISEHSAQRLFDQLPKGLMTLLSSLLSLYEKPIGNIYGCLHMGEPYHQTLPSRILWSWRAGCGPSMMAPSGADEMVR